MISISAASVRLSARSSTESVAISALSSTPTAIPSGIAEPTTSRKSFDGELIPRADFAALRALLARDLRDENKPPEEEFTPALIPETILEPTEEKAETAPEKALFIPL